MTNLRNPIIVGILALMTLSDSWSNSRLPWRNPNPSARLNPKVENHRQQGRIKEWHKLVTKHLQNNQPEKALKFLKETLKLDARNHYSLGMTSYLLLTYRKDFEAAKKMAQDGLNSNPQSIYCLHALAWLHYKQKEYGLAQRVVQEINQPDYAWFEFQFHCAMIHWKAHNRDAAKRHFLLARKLNPINAPLWISIAMFMEEGKNNNVAIKAYQRALNLTKTESPVRDYLITKLDTLLPLYQPREQLNSKFQPINEKDFIPPKISKSKLNPMKKTDESSSKLKAAGGSKNWGRLDKSQNPFLKPIGEDVSKFQKKTRELEQLSLEEHYQVGKELLEIGSRQEAISQFETVINLWSNSEYTIPANTALKDAKNLGFQTYDMRIQKLFNYGTSLFDQKRFKESLHIQRKILLIQPQSLGALKNAAFLYLKFNRPITALKLLDKALKIKPNFSEALLLKAYGLASLRRFTNAAEIISEVMQNSNTGFHKDYALKLQKTINRYQKPFKK